MTLTFGIATRARRGTAARRPTGAIGATRGMSTTTWATTPRAGTRKASAVRRRTSSTATNPARPATSAAEVSAPRCALITAARPRGRRDGSHARAAGPEVGAEESTQLNWETEATGAMWAPELPVRGRRANRGGGRGGSGGPGGPRGPRGSRALVGPGRRGLDRPRVKVKGSWWRHWTLRKALGVLLGVVGGIVVLGAVAVAIAYEETPVPTAALAATGFSQSVVYSKDGTLIGRFGTTNRKMLQYNRDPPGHDQRGGRRRGQELLQRGRHLAHRHRAGRLRGRHRQRRLAAGRLDHHPGVRPAVLQRHRHPADVQPQDQGDLRGHEGGQGEVQAVDPHQLPQHDLPGSGRLRDRGGRGDLLRQAGPPSSPWRRTR